MTAIFPVSVGETVGEARKAERPRTLSLVTLTAKPARVVGRLGFRPRIFERTTAAPRTTYAQNVSAWGCNHKTLSQR